MLPFFCHAFLEDLVPDEIPGVEERRTLVRNTAAYIRASLNLAPFHLRLPLILAVSLFGLWVSLLRPFLPPARAAALWELWGGSPARQVARLVRSLALFYMAEQSCPPFGPEREAA